MQSPNFQLPAGFVLTITSAVGSTGNVRRLAESGSGTTYAQTDIEASTTTLIGPFATSRQYCLTIDAGEITRSVAQAETTDSSASLAATLSDETGTGAAVFGTAPSLNQPLILQPVTLASANGAVTISPGTVVFTKAGVAAMTLAAPSTAQNGTRIVFTSSTANAHTLTATGLIHDGITGGAKSLATFAAFAGASLTLEAYAAKWHVISLNACVIS